MKTERESLQKLLRKAKKLEFQGRHEEADILREEIEARVQAIREEMQCRKSSP